MIQFGDGIEQRQEKGLRKYINNFNDQKFASSEVEIIEMRDFLKKQLTTPFYYTIMGEKYLVRKDGPMKIIRKGAENAELTVSFIEGVR